MKINKFEVIGLFDLYNQTLSFDDCANDEEGASVIMIYGKNGIGKTTILRMINGLMTLNFNIFRKIKFERAVLTFSNKKSIIVKSDYNDNILSYLFVKYNDLEVKLHPTNTGPLLKDDKLLQNTFMKKYENDLENFNFNFIDTERIMKQSLQDEMSLDIEKKRESINGISKMLKNKNQDNNDIFSSKIREFIQDSQINFSNYFSRTEPELFDKIILNLENPPNIESQNLIKRIKNIINREKINKVHKYGLMLDIWDSNKLKKIIEESNSDSNKLTIVSSYLDVLESRSNERISLAERLMKFEDMLNSFFYDKIISIDNSGIKISSKNINSDNISETMLSTGEYHLLYLTTLALCTKVKGTVIAIDEPEMSMHISWQQKLISALIEISSKAFPQMIFATHSPDIAANYSNSLKTVRYGENKA